MALWNGDPTARERGRLTLNPLQARGSGRLASCCLGVLILTRAPFLFGWAKPVPVDCARGSGIRPTTGVKVALARAGVERSAGAWRSPASARVAPANRVLLRRPASMGYAGVVWNCALAAVQPDPDPAARRLVGADALPAAPPHHRAPAVPALLGMALVVACSVVADGLARASSYAAPLRGARVSRPVRRGVRGADAVTPRRRAGSSPACARPGGSTSATTSARSRTGSGSRTRAGRTSTWWPTGTC